MSNRTDQEVPPTWRELLTAARPLVLPGAYDALSARLIEHEGFEATVIGGFSLAGSRYGLPDIGLLGLAEMAAGVTDIINASNLAVLVDADDGYGDVKSVARTVRTYERIGVAALLLEDQVSPKRCGHAAGKDVVSPEIMEGKIRAAVATRSSENLFIIARTDARAVHGLDDALRRCERYIAAGADGIFVEAPETVEELERIARTFDVPQMANMLIGGRTPILSCHDLYEIGFQMVVHGTTLIKRVTRVLQDLLEDLRADALDCALDNFATLDEFMRLTDIEGWQEIERYRQAPD